MRGRNALYNVGQVIHHRLFDYRGVIIDVDPSFQHSDAWYSLMAKTRPDKNQPWYHVLVHDSDYVTYVAEQNLENDLSGKPVNHPEIKQYFSLLKDGNYLKKKPNN